MEASLIDTIFVISLSFLALSLIIFMIFFVPVLVQLAKTLEALQTLINIAKDYVVGINDKLHAATHSLNKVGGYLTEMVTILGEGLNDLFFASKK